VKYGEGGKRKMRRRNKRHIERSDNTLHLSLLKHILIPEKEKKHFAQELNVTLKDTPHIAVQLRSQGGHD
jgi:hypothetical protein